LQLRSTKCSFAATSLFTAQSPPMSRRDCFVYVLFLAAKVHEVSALSVGKTAVGVSGPAPAAPNSHVDPLPVSSHFMEQTYGHLRSGSNRVGSALQNLLEVQSTLEEMQEDMSGEYSRWEQKKQGLTTEKSRLQQEMVNLRETLKKQAAAREEAERLRGALALYSQYSHKTTLLRSEAQIRWHAEQASANKTIDALLVKLNNTGDYKVERVQEIMHVTQQCQEQNRAMQQQILTLNGQVQQLEDVRGRLNADSQSVHTKLLEKIKVLQDGMHSLQLKMIEQAKLRMDERRLSGRTSLLVRQRESIQNFEGACDKKLEDLDKQIASIRGSMSSLRSQAQQCQVTDAENQELQAKLTR